MAERIILDPDEVSTGRTQLDITNWIDIDGVDWGDADISNYMADRERGSAPVDFRLPNRQITIPLNIKQVTAAVTFNQARLALQQKAARLQQEGGWIRRSTTGGTVFADVVSATLKLGGDWFQATRDFDVNAELHLECIPDWYGPEITLGDHVDTTNGHLLMTETGIKGDYPGRLRLVVDEDEGANQMGLLYGIRCRHYSNSTTAQLVQTAAQLTPLDTATLSGGVSINHPSLSTSWTPVCSTDQAGVSLTHTGTYRVWVRTSTALPVAGATPSQLRLLWDVGDFSLPTENAPVQIPGFGVVYAVDLGQVRLDRVPAGTHRWRGVVQAKGPVGGEGVSIARMWLVPVDEGYGVLRAPLTLDPGLNAYLARDEFNQTAGVLTGKTAPVGGAWSSVAGSDTDDFVMDPTGHVAFRTAMADAANTGRLERLGSGTATGAIVVQADVASSAPGAPASQTLGVAARIGSFANHVRAGWVRGNWAVQKVVGGVATTIAYDAGNIGASPHNRPTTVRLYLASDGYYALWAWLAGGQPGSPLVQGNDAQFATGGPLASGGWGIYDAIEIALGATRTYDNFAAWVPSTDAVLFASQSAELRTEGMFREESTGAAFGPVSRVIGDLPRIPPSGTENRSVQIFLKASRGDFESLPDTAVDDISARVTYRPSYLFVS